MRIVKVFLASFLVVSLVFSMVACSSTSTTTNQQQNASTQNQTTQSAEPQNTASEKTYTIGLSFPAADHGWLGAIIQNAKQEAERHKNIKYILTTADNPMKQTADIEDLITQKVDAIVMLPIESAAMTPVADKIKKAGIPLIIVDRAINSENYDVYIGGDNYQIGREAGEYIAKRLNGKGNVVVITGVPSSVTTERTQGFNDVIKNYPDIKVVAMQPGDFQKEKSFNVMQNILQSQPKIDAVYTEDDEMALGVIQAIKNANRENEMFVTGVGGNKQVYELLKNHDKLMAATFVYAPTMSGSAVRLAVNYLEGKGLSELWEKTIPRKIILDAPTVTSENVDKFYDPNANY
ncbi:periplasmic binding protein/LacI transcriptional regulator [Thermoanaerobacter ethanolicus JW 200]|jgi:ribose transport system substrate-binding protein|uniref:substrate-binding domain-containing protein n=1 Tax=Thermoanaerobacter ethanolicus TaxID=1757 RepID=UPI000202D2F4|nr:periplasmic binding protein/LacI transcriptional regulator [Thermoanaerobacter ethanolicus JW 200]MDI3500953.1 ribose transport system substrate-binding protein [Thermoanaerobacter sp.]MDI3529578.1 ribose transport system substrate-binding protein [Thermoanaerobacter sp.]